jgi:hypothetical protein
MAFENKKVQKFIENMYQNPDFCPYIAEDSKFCEMKSKGFNCSNCEPDDRKDFSGRWIETGGKDKTLPVRSKPTPKELFTSIRKIEPAKEESNEIITESLDNTDDTINDPDPIDLSKKQILVVDRRGIIELCDNEEMATNLSEDFIINHESDEILIYKPVKRIARSTSVEDL